MWTFEHTETTSATPGQVWAHYAEPSRWPEWDQDTAEVTMREPMTVGARGKLKPVKGPWMAFTFTEVTPQVGFTDVSRLPLTRLTFTHHIASTTAGSRITHRVSISGPLSPLFARVIGRTIAAGLPTAMQTLARLAENIPAPGAASSATPGR
jgi:hypothetical protein